MCLLVLLVFPSSRGSGDNGSIKFFSFLFSTSKIILVGFLNSEAASALQGGFFKFRPRIFNLQKLYGHGVQSEIDAVG